MHQTSREAAADRRTSYAEVLAVRPFRALFTASALSIGGTSLQILALSVLIYSATGSALLSAVAYGAGFLPQALGGALFTSLADRLPPRRLILTGCLVQAGVALTLGAPRLPTAASIGLVAAAAGLQPLFSAAQAAMLPQLLTGDRYILGRSLLNLASASAQLAGLTAGGVLIAALGGHRAMLTAAAAQLLAGLVIATRLPGYRPAATDRLPRWRPGDTWRGNAALLRDTRVRGLLLLWWLPCRHLPGHPAWGAPVWREPLRRTCRRQRGLAWCHGQRNDDPDGSPRTAGGTGAAHRPELTAAWLQRRYVEEHPRSSSPQRPTRRPRCPETAAVDTFSIRTSGRPHPAAHQCPCDHGQDDNRDEAWRDGDVEQPEHVLDEGWVPLPPGDDGQHESGHGGQGVDPTGRGGRRTQ